MTRYTDEEDQIIAKMREEHFSIKEIANKLHRPHTSVRSRLTLLRSRRKAR